MTRKTPGSNLPEFTSDRLRLLGPLVTPRAVELARERILMDAGAQFFNGKTLLVSDARAVVKIALLVAHIMNPAQKFSTQEEGLMRGMDADGVNPAKKERLIRAL